MNETFMSRGAAWLSSQMASASGKTVRYARASNFVILNAVVGRTTFDVQDSDGMIVKWTSRDFLIEASALVLARAAVTPQQGDTITEYDGHKTYVHEVNAPTGAQAWEWCGTDRLRMRIHTRTTSEGSVA